jgi:hypothetical protein
MRYLLILLFVSSNLYADKYLRLGAGGSGNGSDWINAYTSATTAEANITRGETLWVASSGGVNLGNVTWNVATSGTSVITVKKATVASHGTSTGWSDTYADGPAIFSKWSVSTDYWYFDGQYGYGADWYHTYTPYGFKIQGSGSDNGIDQTSSNIAFNNNVFQYVEIDLNGGSGTVSWDAVRCNGGGDNNRFSYIWMHDVTRCGYKIGTAPGGLQLDNWIIEHNFIDDISRNSQYGTHSEAMSCRATGKVIVRYSVFRNFKSTGGIIVGNGADWEIYGNVFHWTSDLGNTANNGVIGSWSSDERYAVSGFKIYNNTFYGLVEDAKRLFPVTVSSSDHIIRNNIWINCTDAGSVFGGGTEDHAYNAFYNHGVTETEATKQTLSSDPITDAANGDYSLTYATTAGETLEGFSTDMDSVERGADGVWDRGAFELDSGEEPTIPQRTSVSGKLNLIGVSIK